MNELYLRDIKGIPTDRFRVSNNIENNYEDGEESKTNRLSKFIHNLFFICDIADLNGPSISFA